MDDLRSSIDDLIVTVAAQLLGADPAEVQPEPADHGYSATLVGLVHIAGADRYAVALSSTDGFARALASTMFDTDPAETSADLQQEALAEFANVAGGNIKAVLGEGYHLSLPTVTAGSDFLTLTPGGRVWYEHAFAFRGERLRATIWQDDHAAAGSAGTAHAGARTDVTAG